MNLIELFDRAVDNAPARICVRDETTSRTYREMQTSSCRIANTILDLGFAPGTKVATLSDNRATTIECAFGIIRAGAVWVPVATNRSAEATAALLGSLDADLLLYSDRHSTMAYEVARHCPSLRKAVNVDASDAYSSSLPALMASSGTADPRIERAPGDVVTLFCSGGTTGTPKGVMMTNLAWETFVAGFMIRHGAAGPPVHLIVAPLFHAGGGAALGLCALGATHVLLDAFSPEKVLGAIAEHRITHAFLPPTGIRLVLKHPDVRRFDCSSLRCFLYGSAPTPVELIREAVDVFGPVMATSYGQTETGGELTFMPPAEIASAIERGHHERLRSCGRATSFVRVEVMADDGRLLGANEAGELVVRSTQTMSGYYNNPTETERVRQHGWHHTGDVGYRDDDGFFYLVDRKRDLIISAGFNIFPSEIESVLLAHPAVAECAVIGVPHEDWGEVPIAIVEPRKCAIVDTNELHTLCASKLALRQMPQRFEVWTELPRGPAGKISRRLIRERLLAAAA